MEQAPPEPGYFKNLAVPAQHDIRVWRRKGLFGLWSVSERCQGSTYAAGVVANFLVREGLRPMEYRTALGLSEAIRRIWSLQPRAKSFPDEWALDLTEAEEEIERIWFAPLLWIDDLHSYMCPPDFFVKHMWPQIEARVKRKQHTIIATSLGTKHVGLEDVAPVVKSLFGVVDATR